MIPRISTSPIRNKELGRPRDGFAMLSVILVMALISVIMVPIMDLALSSKKSTTRAQITTNLIQEARQNLETGVLLLKTYNGAPPSYSKLAKATTGTIPRINQMANNCARRIGALDADFLGAGGLTDVNNVYSTGITKVDAKEIATFLVTKSSSVRYQRYVIVSCVLANNNLMGIYAAKMAALNNTFYMLSAGSF